MGLKVTVDDEFKDDLHSIKDAVTSNYLAVKDITKDAKSTLGHKIDKYATGTAK